MKEVAKLFIFTTPIMLMSHHDYDEIKTMEILPKVIVINGGMVMIPVNNNNENNKNANSLATAREGGAPPPPHPPS